ARHRGVDRRTALGERRARRLQVCDERAVGRLSRDLLRQRLGGPRARGAVDRSRSGSLTRRHRDQGIELARERPGRSSVSAPSRISPVERGGSWSVATLTSFSRGIDAAREASATTGAPCAVYGADDSTTARAGRTAAGGAGSPIHLSRASSMPRILRESASICFRPATVSASYFSAPKSSNCVSARMAASGLERSCRSFLIGSAASGIYRSE